MREEEKDLLCSAGNIPGIEGLEQLRNEMRWKRGGEARGREPRACFVASSLSWSQSDGARRDGYYAYYSHVTGMERSVFQRPSDKILVRSKKHRWIVKFDNSHDIKAWERNFVRILMSSNGYFIHRTKILSNKRWNSAFSYWHKTASRKIRKCQLRVSWPMRYFHVA